MKRTFGLAAGAFLFAVGCGGADASEPSSQRPSPELLGQEVTEDTPTAMITNPTSGRVGETAFTATLSVTRFTAEGGAIFARVKLHDLTGLAADVAAKLEGSELTLPLSVEPEGGLPSDGSEVFCQALSLVVDTVEVDSAAGALTLDRTVLDTTATPAATFVVGIQLCPLGVLEAGGSLANLPGDLSDTVDILNGLAGAPDEDEAPSSEVVDDASPTAPNVVSSHD